MKNSKRHLIFLLLGLIMTFGLFISMPYTNAITRELYISTIAEKDTYVDTANPTSNYGGVNYLMTGFGLFADIREAYFYFNFSDKPQSYIRADISLEFWGVSQTMNYTICLIEESWDEYSMTWINKPDKGNVIDNILVTGNGIYKIDVTSLISGRTNLSICIYIESINYIDDYSYITSREGFYFIEDAPQLQWVYTENVEITVTSPSSSSNWIKGDTYTITWSSLGSISQVTIELYKASTQIEELTFLYTDNDGSFDFYLSSMDDYEEGSDYRIKITDYDDENVYDYSAYFSITERTYPDISIPSFGIEILISMMILSMIYIIFRVRKNSLREDIHKRSTS